MDTLPVHARSDDWVSSIGRSRGFHMDFGSGTWDGGPIGIPVNLVAGSQVPAVRPSFYYPGESDPGPYPIPTSPLREWGSDHHVLIVDTETCKLYELYDAGFTGGQWSAGSGAIWDLNSHALRPAGWTSADAAGLPILPGLVRYDEVAAGSIDHALRFTASVTQRSYLWPARHHASSNSSPTVPPMGARFRLKASFDIAGFDPRLQVILQAMKSYGIILADNGSNWYVSGTPDERWDNDLLHALDLLTGADFEAVDVAGLMVDPGSGQAQVAATLTVASTNPTSGVTISVSPNDGSGQGSGPTPFTRLYDGAVQVTLTAPAVSGNNTFRVWSGCTSTSGTTCVVTLDGSRTVWANYRDPAITPPARNDFDGDGRSDIGCYDPPRGNWYGFSSTDGFWQTQFGFARTLPVTGDFDGDGRFDIGCYHPAGGDWYVFKSTEGFWTTRFGYEGTVPLGGTLR